jgi:predicted cupin superfamily sugar epimerase
MTLSLTDLRNPDLEPAQVRFLLGLAPHPEGGWYRETWRDVPSGKDARGAATAILFLLAEGEESAWHRVDAAELWLWQAGAPLILDIADGSGRRSVRLGPQMDKDEQLQGIVPAHAWQAARPTGRWSLVSCVVAPAFRFDGFELAPPGFVPLA